MEMMPIAYHKTMAGLMCADCVQFSAQERLQNWLHDGTIRRDALRRGLRGWLRIEPPVQTPLYPEGIAMKNVVCKLFAFFVLLLLAACGGRASQQETQDDSYVMELEALSTTVGPAALEIALTGPDGAPVTDATLNVRGDMSHAGMVPVLQEGHTRNRQGIYSVPFEWTMAGDWIVIVEARLPDGQTITRQFDVTVTGAMNGMEEATE